MYRIYFLLLLLCYSVSLSAQKPPIDSSVFDNWPAIINPFISNNGSYVTYFITNKIAGNRTFVIKSVGDKWEMDFAGVASGDITEDNKFAICKTPGDSLCIVYLNSRIRQMIPDVASYSILKDRHTDWLAYKKINPEGQLVLLNLLTKKQQKLAGVNAYMFNPGGNVLVIEKEILDTASLSQVEWIDLTTNEDKIIWRGSHPFNFLFDQSGEQLVFNSKDVKEEENIGIWYYKSKTDKATEILSPDAPEVDTTLTIKPGSLSFSKNADQLFFYLMDKNIPKPNNASVEVNIWSYKDIHLQPEQQLDLGPHRYLAVENLSSKKIVRLQYDNEKVNSRLEEGVGLFNQNKYVIVTKNVGEDFWWQSSARSVVYLESIQNGTRILIKKDIVYAHAWQESLSFRLSPDEKFVLYYDPTCRNYFSYNIGSHITRNITSSINVKWKDEYYGNKWADPGFAYSVGIAGWIEHDSAVLIYDNYDIWKIDPQGIQRPINITNTYGSRHHIKFRIICDLDSSTNLSPAGSLLLSAFNPITKENGLYCKELSKSGNPKRLVMSPLIYYISQPKMGAEPIKAAEAATWLVTRMNYDESPNLYLTKDFKVYDRLTDIRPEKQFNWITAELVHWKSLDGSLLSGVMYKPENFDPNKKYPLIFNYYEEKSDELHEYKVPNASEDNINIPYFVSNGYLVFVPDIHYKIGFTGESAVNSIVSAAQYLAKLPWVEPHKMGIQGHSYGGFETNYVVTHTHLFAAAAEAAGVTNLISGYDEITGWGTSRQEDYEIYQGRMRATLWKRPDLYIRESPIFSANKVTTPLLMMHNAPDGAVPFGQAIELYSALRRLGKKVWLLQYDEGGHSVNGKDARDYTIRLTEFFNYYLKGSPPPKWMTVGIPAKFKGIENGYELDTSGAKP